MQGAGRAKLRRATLAICLVDAAILLWAWQDLGGSDHAGNALASAYATLFTLIFAVTALPALALAIAGRLPRVALALALVFLLAFVFLS